jgi:hypothetical protein
VHRCIDFRRGTFEFVPCKQSDVQTVMLSGGKITLCSSIFGRPTHLLLTSRVPGR